MSMSRDHPPEIARSIAGMLSEIADLTSETLDLTEVFGRVAASVVRVVPYDRMGVLRIVDGERAVLHATTHPAGDASGASPEVPLSAWSPRWRPQPRRYPRIDDAKVELDPSFPQDAEAIQGGVRSVLWEPFRRGNSFVGGVWLCSCSTHAFGEEHQEALRPIAAILGSAMEHWMLWDAERLRRERLERVDSLLGTLTESLDVREIFERLSADLQPILPHQLMNLTELDLRARTIRIAAFAGECDIPIRTDPFPLTEREVEDRTDFAIVDDILEELKPDTERQRLIRKSGMRSWLHVPVWLSGEIKGSLSFLHREPCRYRSDDAEVALRVAARVALTLSHQRLAEEARRAAESRERANRLEATVENLVRELESRTRNRVVGVSRSWKESLQQVGRVAGADTTVLLTGESGTGKEVLSGLIHRGSKRARNPFVAINCAALPEHLLESELFGHEKGAFTGAIATKIGRVEQAAGGTLFLDEVAEMSPPVQAKLLRVLEAREFQRVGGTRTFTADVRVIAATNRDLAAAMDRHTFREDLFYRLNVFQIHIAPLRERREDILPLAEMFLEDLAHAMGRPVMGISPAARDWLLSHPWPGNVRELRNAIERALLMCDGGTITRDDLLVPGARPAPGMVRDGDTSIPRSRDADEAVDLGSVERRLIAQALDQSRGNKAKAARLLGLTRSQLYTRLGRYGMS